MRKRLLIALAFFLTAFSVGADLVRFIIEEIDTLHAEVRDLKEEVFELRLRIGDPVMARK